MAFEPFDVAKGRPRYNVKGWSITTTKNGHGRITMSNAMVEELNLPHRACVKFFIDKDKKEVAFKLVDSSAYDKQNSVYRIRHKKTIAKKTGKSHQAGADMACTYIVRTMLDLGYDQHWRMSYKLAEDGLIVLSKRKLKRTKNKRRDKYETEVSKELSSLKNSKE